MHGELTSYWDHYDMIDLTRDQDHYDYVITKVKL